MFPDAVNFDIFLAVMAVTAVVVFITLHYVEAGYDDGVRRSTTVLAGYLWQLLYL